MAYILENKISIFSLALIFSSFCLASSTKDFSYSFLREDGNDKEAQNKAVDEPEAGKEAVELREEEVDSRDLQAQLLDEANKVEEAVRRLGSFRGSDKQEGKEQYEDKYKEEEKVEVVVSKSEAVLLCSFFKDRARLPFPEYCESEEGALGKEKDGQEAFKKNDDRHQEGKRDTAVVVETLAVKKDSTKLINNPQLAEVVHVDNVVGPKRQRQQPMASQDPSNQWDSVSNMLRTFGFQRFLYPAQRHENFMGSPHGFQQASSPAWYPAQPQTSPYEAFMSNLHLQRLPHQHLHIHMSQGMGSDLTNQEENVKSRKKRNSMLPWPFRGWQSSFSLGIPLPNYLFNPLNLGFNPHILPNLDFQLLSRASPQLPLWQPTAPGRGHKFSSSLAYQPMTSSRELPELDLGDVVKSAEARRRPNGSPQLGCTPQPVHQAPGGIIYYKCREDNRPLPTTVNDIQLDGHKANQAHIFAFVPEQRSIQQARRSKRSLLTDIAITVAAKAAYDYITSEGTRATLEPSSYTRYRPAQGYTTVTTSTVPWEQSRPSFGSENKRCPWGTCF